MAELRFRAVELPGRAKCGYLLSIDAIKLLSIVTVNRRTEEKEDGYQRAFSVTRAKSIGKYIDAGNPIAGVIIVAFDKARFDAQTNELVVEDRAENGWVIDGQHRLFGASIYAAASIELGVLAYVDLPLESQIEIFVTINKEQKGVPSSLYLDLLKKLPRTLSEKEMYQVRASAIVNRLQADPQSPFYNRIVITTSPIDGQVSLVNFVRKLEKHIRPNGHLANYREEIRVAIISNLFASLILQYPLQKNLFYKTVVFGAILECLPDIMQCAALLAGKLSYTRASFDAVFSQISGYDFKPWVDYGSGNRAETSAAQDFREQLLEIRANVEDPIV